MSNNTSPRPLAAQSQEELCSRIECDFAQLSKRLQQIARYVLDHQTDIAFNTVTTIAEQAKVHPSSLIRFAKALDFSGFSDMQKLFRAKLASGQKDYQKRIESVQGDVSLDQEHASKELLTQICDANSHALSTLAQHVSGDELELARDILQQANTIHVQGVRRSFPVASYLSYLLSNMNLPVHLIDSVGGMIKQQQSLIHTNDAVVAISFYPYGAETTDLLNLAAEKKCPVVVFTDSPISPLAKMADVCFCVKEAEIHSFRSLNATLCLVQAVAISLVQK